MSQCTTLSLQPPSRLPSSLQVPASQTPNIRQVPLGYVPQWLSAMPFETWSSAILNDILFLFSNTLPLVFYSFLSLGPALWPGPLTGLEFTVLPSRADSYPSNLFIIVYSGKKYSRSLCLNYTKTSQIGATNSTYPRSYNGIAEHRSCLSWCEPLACLSAGRCRATWIHQTGESRNAPLIKTCRTTGWRREQRPWRTLVTQRPHSLPESKSGTATYQSM
jgi:hypothetical protein